MKQPNENRRPSGSEYIDYLISDALLSGEADKKPDKNKLMTLDEPTEYAKEGRDAFKNLFSGVTEEEINEAVEGVFPEEDFLKNITPEEIDTMLNSAIPTGIKIKSRRKEITPEFMKSVLETFARFSELNNEIKRIGLPVIVQALGKKEETKGILKNLRSECLHAGKNPKKYKTYEEIADIMQIQKSAIAKMENILERVKKYFEEAKNKTKSQAVKK